MAISDGLPVSDPNSTPNHGSVLFAIMEQLFMPSFLELLSKLNDTKASNNIPPVSCLVSDGCMPFAVAAAEKFGIPILSFITISACGLLGKLQVPALIDRGILPIKDNSDLDNVLESIPGMEGIRLKDISGFVRSKSFNNIIYEFIKGAAECTSKSCAVVIHTFEALEHDVLRVLSSMCPAVYAVGPLPLILDRIHIEDPLRSIYFNSFREERECIEWLNTREKNSVLYVNFGSIACMQPKQLIEFARGLANSKHNFLWVFRPDRSVEYTTTLPPEFVEETKEIGMITGWCPQEEVLNHPAVGGFLTHCGWNSILESLCAGVPMICWPFFGDQPPNSKYSCNEWGIGLELDGDNVTSEGVEKLVRELMEGEKGRAMKSKAMEWKKKAEEAVTSYASLSVNLNKMVNAVLECKK